MTGYTQANILGKDRGLKFGNLAAEQITLELVALGAVTGGSYSSAMMTIIIYWGLYNNCWSKKIDVDFTFEEVEEWVGDNLRKKEQLPLFEAVAKAYEESQRTHETIQDLKEKVEDIKKKTGSISASEPDGKSSEVSPSGSSDGHPQTTTTAP